MPLDTSTDPQVGFRPPGTLDIANAFERYEGPFRVREAAHLARRTGFGATLGEVADLQGRGMNGTVDARIHPTGDAIFPDYPSGGVLYDPKKRFNATQMWWYDRLVRTPNPLQEKIALFWHGHFATSVISRVS